MSFKELDQIAKITARTDGNDGFFQRDEEAWKVKEIAEYIEKEMSAKDVPLFSTPIVLGIEDGYYDENWWGTVSVMDYERSHGGHEIILEITENVRNCAIIVDGQHRYKWLKKFFEKYPGINQEDIDIPVIFLFNYDLYELGKIFININFKQKPVNKSLYYDIFGSLPRPVSEIKIAHLLVQDLNNADAPLFWVIKMLGKGNGLLSQSFLVEKIVDLLNKSSVWLDDYNSLHDYYKDRDENENVDNQIRSRDEYMRIKEFLFEYFKTIKTKFLDYTYTQGWDSKIESKWIIFKTTWIGALMRLIEDFYINKKQYQLGEMFSKIENEANVYFWLGSDFAGAGSEWLQLKLYKALSQKIFYGSAKDNVKNAIQSNYRVGDEFLFRDIHSKTIKSLEESYPNNNFLEAKLLQTLQVLRDQGDIEFVSGTRWKYKRLV